MIAASVTCVALAVYFEARNQPLRGQYGVAEVVVNRVADGSFPNTACDVISEDRGPKSWDCQFSFMCDGNPETTDEIEAWELAQKIALEVWWKDTYIVEGATYFAVDSVSNSWTQEYTMTTAIGDHRFYKP